MTKHEKIKNFLEKHKNVAPQRTAEWYRNRGIGGSEIFNIIRLKNTNINNFVNNFLYKKLIPQTNPFIFPCVFGNIFENEIKNLSEYNFNTKIYETGSIKYEKLKCVSYSPDGFGIVNDEIVLFEFKCPITREINKEEIKFEYLMQVNSGLHVLEEVVENKGLYIEAEFKKCTLDELTDDNSFDKIFHNKNLNRDFSELYKHFGMILFYEETEPVNAANDVIDLGDASIIKMETLFYNVYKKKFKYLYLSDIINDNNSDIINDNNSEIINDNNSEIINDNNSEIIKKYISNVYSDNKKLFNKEEINYLKGMLINECIRKKYNPLYILPWKCFNYNVIEVKKNNDFFTDELKERCLYFSYIVKYIATLNLENEEEIKQLLLKYTKQYLK
jgi:hypothetical protein